MESALTKQEYLRQVRRDFADLSLRQKLIKRDILHNRTTDFELLYRYNVDESHRFGQEFKTLGCQSPLEDSLDLIIYTYDQHTHLKDHSHNYLFFNSHLVKVSQIKSEKQLKDQLQKGFSDQRTSKCIIILQYSRDYHLLQQILFLSKKIKAEKESEGQIIIIIEFHRFTFIRDPVKRLNGLNVSHLHGFNQYFIQRFDIQMGAFLEKVQDYFSLFEQLHFRQRLHQLYIEAVTWIKFVPSEEDQAMKKDWFNIVRNLFSNKEMQKQLFSFLQYGLGYEKVDFALLHTDKKEAASHSTTLDALESLTAKVTTKYIFIFLELLIKGHYFDLFEEQIEVQNIAESKSKTEVQLRMNMFRAAIEDKKKLLKKSGQQLLEKIKVQKEANEILFRSNKYFFPESIQFFEKVLSAFRDRVAIEKQYNLNEDAGIDSYFASFEPVFKLELSNNPNLALAFAEMQGIIIKDCVTFRFKNKGKSQLQLLNTFFSQTIRADLLVKMYILLISTDRTSPFSHALQLLQCIISHYTNWDKLVVDLRGKIEISKVIEDASKMRRMLLMKAIDLLNITSDAIADFKDVDCFYRYFKELNGKIVEISMQDPEEQIPTQYILLKGFYQMLQLHFMDQKNQILTKFISFAPAQSTLQRIYYFTVSLIEEDPDQKEGYESFLSIGLFQCWLQIAMEDNEEDKVKVCIDSFVSWCNKSPQLADKGFKFFGMLFSELQSHKHPEDIEEYLRHHQTNKLIKSHLSGENFFTLSLNNVFVKQTIAIFFEQNGKALGAYLYLFDRWVTKAIDPESAEGNFKVAFIKVYLAEYLAKLMRGEEGETTKQIDKALCQDGGFISHSRLFLIKLIKLQHSAASISKQFFQCRRCQWITLEKELVAEKLEGLDIAQTLHETGYQEFMTAKYQYLYLFKTLQLVEDSKEGADIEEAVYSCLTKKHTSLLLHRHPFLYKLIKVASLERRKTLDILQHIKHIFNFLTTMQRLCNHKIRRHEKRRIVSDYLEQTASHNRQRNKLLSSLKNYCNAVKYFKDNGQHLAFETDCTSFATLSVPTQASTLNSFLLHENNAQQLISFVSILSKLYNEIVLSLKGSIAEVNPKSMLLSTGVDRLNPTNVQQGCQKYIQFPSEDLIKATVFKFSNYSVLQGHHELSFFFKEIESRLLNKFKYLYYSQENSKKFTFVHFIGQNHHFLKQLKQNDDKLTLEATNKLKTVQDYFAAEKKAKGGTFHKTIKTFLKSLQLVMIYHKNANKKNKGQTLQEVIQQYQIPHLTSQLKEDPFRRLPLSVLIDLYEYVEALSFDGIENLLHEKYKQKMQEETVKKFDATLRLLKGETVKNFPLFMEFKKALYRLVLRDILGESIGRQETLKDYLGTFSYYWGKESKEIFESINPRFVEGLNIEVRHMYYIIERVPFKDKGEQRDQPERAIRKIPNRRLL